MSQPENQKLSDPSPTEAHFSTADDSPELPAWTEVEAGRFMPRRVRGSCQGRALGWTFTVGSSGSDEEPQEDTRQEDRHPQ